MADNVTLPGTGAVVATDDVGGSQFQRVKLDIGGDGASSPVVAGNGLPVAVVGTVPVSGTVGVTGAYQATQPVSIASMPSTPVTGTFWQATQPISGTVGVSGSVAVTGTFWQATQPVSGTVTVGNASLAVTGTFFQATQPVSIAATVVVSGPLTDTQLRATAVPISGTVTANVGTGTQPVSGTFWQATQPISAASLPLPTGAATETTLAALNTKVTAVNTGAVTISAALPAGANTIGTTTGPTLTKGTQGASGYSVQDLKDAGRVIVNAATAIAGVTAVTTEALLTLNVSRDGAATSGVTTIAVTSGKRLRILGMTVGIISTAAAVISARISLRMNPSGAAAANSPILVTAPLSQQAAALAQAGNEMSVMFPEAIEISGTMQVGISQVASV
ncbi:MAG: hypothetical protein V4696_09510, partial [Pseudomonadota bacterium]